MKRFLFKVCMAGEGGVGKTSLIIRFCQNRFTEEYKPTLGADFAVKKVEVGDSEVTLQIWDLSGQERFEIMRKYYFKGASAGVLVFDVTRPETFLLINRWIEAFYKHSGGGFLVLVGNKMDLEDKRLVPPQAGEMITKWLNIPYFETSAKTGENVFDVFTFVAEKLLEKAQ